MNPIKHIIFSLFFIGLVVFLWYGALKPLYINRDTNIADRYARTGQCELALELMRSKVIYNQSNIDSYSKLKYISIVERCNARSQESIDLLKEVGKIRPYYTRTFIFLGNYTGDQSYFDQASELSFKREEIFVGRANMNMILKDYQSSLKNTKDCLLTNPMSKQCWWLKALSNYYLNNIDEANKDIEFGMSIGLNTHSKYYLLAIEKACEANNSQSCYQKLFETYKELIKRYTEDTYQERKEKLLFLGQKINQSKEAKEIVNSYDILLKEWKENENK